MKRIVVICTFILFGFLTSGQNNLVTNPSFEVFSSCPNNIAQIYYALGWDGNSVDYFNACAASSSQVSVPYNLGGYQQAVSGNAYVALGVYFSPSYVGGNNVRESVEGTLTSPLMIGTKYFVSFKVSSTINSAFNLNCVSNNLGAMFSTVLYSPNPAPITNNPKVYTSAIITDSSNWTRISGSFVADSAYTYIIIGNFFDNSLTDTLILDGNSHCNTAYYYLDDVCVSTDSLSCNGSIGINNFDNLDKNFEIYPNPNTGSFTISLKEKGKQLSVEIFNVLGQQMQEKQFSIENKGEVKIEDLSEGLYLVKFVVDGVHKRSERIVVTR